jgi:hypothetical protein
VRFETAWYLRGEWDADRLAQVVSNLNGTRYSMAEQPRHPHRARR